LWVNAVCSGDSINDLIPVNVPPERNYADMLNSRLDFLRKNFIDVNINSIESDV
jgi:hypothetical protein